MPTPERPAGQMAWGLLNALGVLMVPLGAMSCCGVMAAFGQLRSFDLVAALGMWVMMFPLPAVLYFWLAAQVRRQKTWAVVTALVVLSIKALALGGFMLVTLPLVPAGAVLCLVYLVLVLLEILMIMTIVPLVKLASVLKQAREGSRGFEVVVPKAVVPMEAPGVDSPTIHPDSRIE